MTTARDQELHDARTERDRYATAYRKLIEQLEQKRIESDDSARAIEEKKVRGKGGQLIPHECAIAISGLAGGYLTATELAINLFEGPEAWAAYLQRTVPAPPSWPDTTGCEDHTLEPQEEDEPELTEVQKAYNVAQSELSQLAAYGHHTHWPQRRNDGTYLSPREQDAGRKDYCERIHRAQTRFEAAALMKAAEFFQGVLDAEQAPQENPQYWTAIHHMVQGLQRQAADLLKEL